MNKLAQYKSCIMFYASGFAIFALLLCLTACSATQVNRQEQRSVIEQKAITTAITEKQLVSDNVRCIYASHGNIWVGTDRGVSVYHEADNRWDKLDREDGLISDDVTDIAVDGVNVWIGTHIGLSHYNAETKKWRKFQKRDGLTHNHVNAVAIDGHYVWIGTENGISRYDSSIGAWASQIEKEKEGLNAITAIAADTEYVWFGTEGGLRRYDKAKDAWNTYTKEEGLVDNSVVCIALSPDAVWVGTRNSGVSRFSIAHQAFTESHDKTTVLESDYIKTIVVDGDNVWFGSADRGIRRYLTTVDTWLKYTAEEGLISDHITELISSGQYIWIGTAEGGLGRFDKSNTSWRWYSRKDRLASTQIHDLAWSGTALWIGTNRGLSRYDPIENDWTTYTKANGLVTNYITSVAVDRKNSVAWIGTSLGLGVIQDNRWRFFTQRNGLTDDFVTNVSIFQGEVWAATRSGLNVLQLTPENHQPRVKSHLEDWWVTSTLRLGKDLWAGTTAGLYRKASETEAFEPYPTIRDYVNTLAQGSNGELLVGTRNGLWVIKDNTPLHITEGLPNPNVRSIVVDNDVMWIGTPGGVGRFEDNLKVQQILTMESDGLLHNNVRSIAIGGNRVFFGTVAGLTILDESTGRWDRHKPYHGVDILQEDDIRWMAKDGDYFWVLNWSASPNGAILRFDRRTDTWMTYTKESLPLSGNPSLITDVPRIAVGEEDVWISTDNGMLQYNKRSDTWKHLPLNRRTEHVAIDRSGGIWASLRGGAHYDKQTGQWETFYVVDPGDGGRVESVACTNDYVWFGTGEHGIRRYDWRTKTWKAYTEAHGLASRFGRWIVADGEDVWTGGDNAYSWISGRELHGVSRYRANLDMWIIYNERMGVRAARPNSGHIGERYIWSYGWNGIDRCNRATETWTSFTRADGVTGQGRVEAVAEDGDTFWVGTHEDGVLRYYEASGAWLAYGTEDGLASNEIRNYGIKVDPEYVWVGTAHGLSRYNKENDTWATFVKQETLASRRVVAVAVDERYVWAGTQRGLGRYDKKYDTWRHFENEKVMNEDQNNERTTDESEEEVGDTEEDEISELVDNNVVDLSVGKRYVWIATEGGVGRYDRIADRFDAYTEENHLPSADIRAIGENRTDVWIGTMNGVSKHNIFSDDPNAWETYNAAIEITTTVAQKYTKSLENDDVRCLAVDNNRVWIGTKTGVSVYDFSERTWRTFTQRDGLASQEVSCIGVDKTRVWFGSGHGTTVYDTATGIWRVYKKKDGLGSDLITSIAINDTEIWFGTFDNGVTVLTKATGEFSILTMADGLPHNGILSLAMDGDFVWIGTHGGLTRYDTLTKTWTVFTEHFDHDGI